jgi:predicted nucleotidyltransferase
MDKNDALKICRSYLKKVRQANMDIAEAWLFGSYASGRQHEDSDIDIAIVFNKNGEHTFETEVKLMVIRNGEETIIEPHAFTKEEFTAGLPIVNQILRYGERIAF